MATLLAGAKLRETDPSKLNADEDAKNNLFEQMQAWLCRDQVSAPYRSQTDLMRAITDGDEDAYVRAQAEALAYLRWLKKFATAFLDKQGSSDASLV
jgi:CRISPR-associated protein Cmr5